MKTCAYCGAANLDEALTCSGCGTSPIQSGSLEPKEVNGNAVAHPEEEESESLLCPSCLEPNRSGAAFCLQCGGIIGASSGLAPLEAGFTRGHGNPRALDSHPKPIILIVVWVIFYPAILMNLRFIRMLVEDGYGRLPAALGIVVLGALIALCVYVLYWNTRNYLKRTQEIEPSGPADE
jgi:hypothetical protein